MEREKDELLRFTRPNGAEAPSQTAPSDGFGPPLIGPMSRGATRAPWRTLTGPKQEDGKRKRKEATKGRVTQLSLIFRVHHNGGFWQICRSVT